MLASFVETTGALLTVMAPLVAVPLTAITFYLRSLREQQRAIETGVVRRMECVEQSVVDMRRTIGEFERDYATKEEWVRECMHARRTIEQLTEMTVRLDATVSGSAPATPIRDPSDARGTGTRRPATAIIESHGGQEQDER